jgi:hypothetical protein
MTRRRNTQARELRRGKVRRGVAPGLDSLEGRTLLSTLLVTSTLDSGPGSLRQAVQDSVRGDTILFTPITEGQPVQLLTGPIRIRHDLTIQGLGSDQTIVSGSGASRVFDIVGRGVDVTLADLTLRDGVATPQSPGALAQLGRRTLRDRISDAKALDAGGLVNALTRQAGNSPSAVPIATASTLAGPLGRTNPTSNALARAQALDAGGVINALTRRAQAVDATPGLGGSTATNVPGLGGTGNPTGTPTAPVSNPPVSNPPSDVTGSASSATGGTVTPAVGNVSSPATNPSRSVQASVAGLGQAIDHGTQALADAKARAARPGVVNTLGTTRPANSSQLAHPALSAAGLGGAVAQAAVAARSQGRATPGSALGGAIYMSGGNLTVINSVLANNQAIGSGGGNAGAGGRGGDAIGSAMYTLGSGFNSAANQFQGVSVTGGDGANGGGGGGGSVTPVISNSSLNLANVVKVSPNTPLGTTGTAPRVFTKNHGVTGGGNGGNGGNGGDALGGGIFSMGHHVRLVGNLFTNSHAVGGNGANGGGGGNGAVDVTVNGTTSIARYNVHGIRTGGGRGGEGGRGGNAFGGAVFNIGSNTSFVGNSFVDVSATGGNGGNGGGGGGGATSVVMTDTNASILGGNGGNGGLGLGGGLFNL